MMKNIYSARSQTAVLVHTAPPFCCDCSEKNAPCSATTPGLFFRTIAAKWRGSVMPKPQFVAARSIVYICAASLLLVACSDDNEDLVRYINEVKHRKTREIEPIPSFAPLSKFQFPDNDNRRNPFKPIAQQKTQVDLNAPDKNRPKEPLEAFPLDALKFVGTLKKGDETWALIELPDKDIAHVHVGNYMGQNYGRIVSIHDDAIELIETVKTSGKWKKHKTTVKLYTGK